MDLQSFVRDSITSVIRGVQEAQREFRGAGADRPVIGSPHDRRVGASKPETGFRFDVAVTVEKRGRAEGRAKSGSLIRVLAVDASGKLEGSAAKSNVSRLSFEVPIIWPGHPGDPAPRG
jgi:hypothetical protein